MANANTLTPIISSEQRGVHLTNSNMSIVQPPLSQPGGISADGPVGILWDIENCPVPSAVRPEDVVGNIRMALRVHPVIKGAVMTFSAYGDFNGFPRRLREGCQRTGVKLIDVPNGRKDAADKAILVDMFLFALDNPPPSSIVLISGDVDFAPALHVLGQRGYTIILVIPSGVGVSSALSSAGKFVWDWPSVAHGEGFVPPTKPLFPTHSGPVDISGHLIGCHISDNFDGQNEEAVVYREISQSYQNTRDFSMVSQPLSKYNSSSSTAMPCFPSTLRSQSLPSGLNEVSSGPVCSVDQLETVMWVQPGDINGLKMQLVKLLELFGGCLPLNRICSEFQKVFGRPLCVSEYGVPKLINLFKKMSDAMAIDGKNHNKFVYLRNWKAGPSAPPLPSARKVKKGKRAQEECIDVVIGNGFSDEFSDEERVMIQEHDERRNQGSFNMGAAARSNIDNDDLGQFSLELQEILVSYSCKIFLGCFESIYQQRYKKPLEYQKFGVDQLEKLFEKVRDVVVLHEEPITKRKFLEAVGG